jgi:hypothetical protein
MPEPTQLARRSPSGPDAGSIPHAELADHCTHPETRRIDALADLIAIFEPGVQVVVHERPLPPPIAAALAVAGAAAGGLRRVVDAGGALPLPTLPMGAGRDALAADLASVTELYVDLLGCARIGLRLERLDRAMCPGWHCDRTGIRLLCTYRGPGTEWLDDAGLERAALPGSAADRPPDGRAAAGDIVLLKGSLWQGNAGRGAIHRSPAPDGNGRWLLALDAIW